MSRYSQSWHIQSIINEDSKKQFDSIYLRLKYTKRAAVISNLPCLLNTNKIPNEQKESRRKDITTRGSTVK